MDFMNAGRCRLILRGFSLWACMVLLFARAGLGETQAPAPVSAAAQEKTRAQRIMERLRDSDGKDVLVCAHRADWRHFPENSLEIGRASCRERV